MTCLYLSKKMSESEGIINLVNTLLIPLLVFLVANRDVIFDLLGWSM